MSLMYMLTIEDGCFACIPVTNRGQGYGLPLPPSYDGKPQHFEFIRFIEVLLYSSNSIITHHKKELASEVAGWHLRLIFAKRFVWLNCGQVKKSMI